MSPEVHRRRLGSLRQGGTGLGTHTYQWDGEGRMVSVGGVAGQACQSTWTACYVYNALGQRVEKRVGSAYTEYMFDPAGQVIGTHDRTYVAQRLFRLNGRPVAIHRDSNTKFPHGNALGSTMFVTNYYGVTDQKTLYAPYGELIAQAGQTARDPRFASMEQRDAETDFDPTPARLYQNRLYRWMSPDDFTGGPVDAITASLGGADPTPPGPLPYADILNPQSLNKYAYAYNNPLRYNDPTGHRDSCENTSECQEYHKPASLYSYVDTAGKQIVVRGKQTTLSTDASGKKTTAVIETQAAYSTAKGREGEFNRAYQSVTVTSAEGKRVSYHEGPIGEGEAARSLGSGAINSAIAQTVPGLARSFGRYTAQDIKAHPGKYVAALVEAGIAATPAGPLAYPKVTVEIWWNLLRLEREIAGAQ